MVTGEAEEERDGSGGWVLVQAQRKTRKGKVTHGVKEDRTGRLQ